ncbi:hypothetical protein H9P43_005370 [Blastocladiella emersonii ATCC 22665]|nr:hypothetical protein H9P43_005370 [Blastocladiella emersonii ATCC 22665]
MSSVDAHLASPEPMATDAIPAAVSVDAAAPPLALVPAATAAPPPHDHPAPPPALGKMPASDAMDVSLPPPAPLATDAVPDPVPADYAPASDLVMAVHSRTGTLLLAGFPDAPPASSDESEPREPDEERVLDRLSMLPDELVCAIFHVLPKVARFRCLFLNRRLSRLAAECLWRSIGCWMPSFPETRLVKILDVLEADMIACADPVEPSDDNDDHDNVGLDPAARLPPCAAASASASPAASRLTYPYLTFVRKIVIMVYNITNPYEMHKFITRIRRVLLERCTSTKRVTLAYRGPASWALDACRCTVRAATGDADADGSTPPFHHPRHACRFATVPGGVLIPLTALSQFGLYWVTNLSTDHLCTIAAHCRNLRLLHLQPDRSLRLTEMRRAVPGPWPGILQHHQPQEGGDEEEGTQPMLVDDAADASVPPPPVPAGGTASAAATAPVTPDQAIAWILSANGRGRLHELNLWHLPLTGHYFSSIPLQWVRLLTIGNVVVPERDLLAIATPLVHLTSLTIDHPRNRPRRVPDGVAHLIAMAPNLRALYIKHLVFTRIVARAIASLAQLRTLILAPFEYRPPPGAVVDDAVSLDPTNIALGDRGLAPGAGGGGGAAAAAAAFDAFMAAEPELPGVFGSDALPQLAGGLGEVPDLVDPGDPMSPLLQAGGGESPAPTPPPVSSEAPDALSLLALECKHYAANIDLIATRCLAISTLELWGHVAGPVLVSTARMPALRELRIKNGFALRNADIREYVHQLTAAAGQITVPGRPGGVPAAVGIAAVAANAGSASTLDLAGGAAVEAGGGTATPPPQQLGGDDGDGGATGSGASTPPPAHDADAHASPATLPTSAAAPLRVLHIHYASLLTDPGILQLVYSVPSLRYLVVTESRVTVETLWFVAQRGLASLRRLTVSGPHVRKRDLDRIAHVYPREARRIEVVDPPPRAGGGGGGAAANLAAAAAAVAAAAAAVVVPPPLAPAPVLVQQQQQAAQLVNPVIAEAGNMDVDVNDVDAVLGAAGVAVEDE